MIRVSFWDKKQLVQNIVDNDKLLDLKKLYPNKTLMIDFSFGINLKGKPIFSSDVLYSKEYNKHCFENTYFRVQSLEHITDIDSNNFRLGVTDRLEKVLSMFSDIEILSDEYKLFNKGYII